ncbi:hypothetical protein GCM10010215_67090 [Streptomyces virginiae]|uniref:Lipoprotein n=1 Tax=Streptomyces virginiae TaxID=1961 RepID=A0ABQ3NMZ3_STRVG|nr:hypothetical protein [Streptomyces virginiae]MBP2341995.1 hypothetical protein [Streptomyces virginiae]GGQ33724.1 hypothetical protein GCM10010215_67090 [Streptomyces virginiae]GHI14129.1 hypothetical protein Scinn_35920 [Streptomyces virginiae]
MRVSSKRNRLLSAAGISALAVFSGLFFWWNTNLLGDDEFCDGAVTSEELASVLDTKGRLSTTSSVGDSKPGFSCSVQRTSKFLGASPMEIQMRTAAQEPDFQFQTHVWKNPSAMSFFSNGSTGAVSDERGWVLLPETCQGKVATFSPSGSSSQTAADVRTVEAIVKQGTANRAELAKTLVKAAQRIAEEAGCAADGANEEPRLQAVSEAPTAPGAACGLAGFTLPPAALLKEEATVGKEQVSGSIPGTWACGMQLAGNAKGVIWFAASSDARIVDPILRKDTLKDLPGGVGVTDRDLNAAALKCGDKMVYFGMRWSDEYRSAVSDRGISVSHEMFQSFVDSAGKQYQCGVVQLPPN